MQVVQIHKFGSPDVLSYETKPDIQPEAGEILIKVGAASVNFSDVLRRSNATYPFPTPLPFIPGSEVAGTVAALGAGVTGPDVGTPVFALAGGGANGYAQYARTPAHFAIPIPEGVSVEQAAALPVAGTTAIMLLRETARLQARETVLIQGAAGGVGSYAVQLAKLFGAKVIGAVSSEAKASKVKALGADAAVDYSRAGWAEEVLELTEGHGADVILEMRGGTGFQDVLRCLAPFGRCVVYGMASGQPLVLDDAALEHFFYDPARNQSLHVYNLGLWFGMRPRAASKALQDLIGYVAAGQVKVNIDDVLPLQQAADAHRLLETRKNTGKIILKPWDN